MIPRPEFILYFDKSDRWPEYVKRYSSLRNLEQSGTADVRIERLPQKNDSASFARLPESLRRLLFFGKPDLVICLDDRVQPVRPVFSFEISRHVMIKDHWMQRFPYLVGSAREGVPGAYVMPGDMPHRPKFRSEVDPRFFFVYDRVIEIHRTPIYIAQWPSSDGETLDLDRSFSDLPDHTAEDLTNAFDFLDLVLDAALHGRSFSQLMRDRLLVDLRDSLRGAGYANIPEVSDFKRLTYNMPEGRLLSLPEVDSWVADKGLSLPDQLPDRIEKRERNLIYVPQVRRAGKTTEDLRDALKKRIKQKGGDPYKGQPLAHDYLFCRLGPTPYERDRNLILDLSVLDFSDFAEYHVGIWRDSPLGKSDFADVEDRVPTYTLHLLDGIGGVIKDFVRLYAYAADIIVFRDGIIYF